MATFKGSGAFIGVAAGTQEFYGDEITGISVGRNTDIYCKIAPIYKKTSSGSITTSALNIFSDMDDTELDYIILDDEPGEYIDFHKALNIDLSKVTKLRIRGREPYTGYVQCLYDVDYDIWGAIGSSSWVQIYFDKGFLNWPNSRVIG